MAEQMYVDWDGLQYYHGRVTEYISTISEGFFKAGGDLSSLEGVRPCYDNLNFVYKLTTSFTSNHDFVTPNYNYAEGTIIYVRNLEGVYKFDILFDAVKRDEDFTHDLEDLKVAVEKNISDIAALPDKNFVAQAVADLGDYVETNYASSQDLSDAYATLRTEMPSLEGYVKEEVVTDKIDSALVGYATKEYVEGGFNRLDIPKMTSQLINDSKFVNTDELNAAVSTRAENVHNHTLSDISDYAAPDLSPYAKVADIPTKVSQLDNDAKYLTEHQDLSSYATIKYVDDTVKDVNNKVELNTTKLDDIISDVAKAENQLLTHSSKIIENDRRIDTLDVAVALKADKTEVPTKISDLLDDKGLVGYTQLAQKADAEHIHRLSDIIDYVAPTIPTNVSELNNDKKYQTKDDVDAAINKIPVPDLTPYATTAWVNSQKFLTKVPDSYVTEAELNNKGFLQSIPDEYVTITELASKGYVNILDLATYAKKSDIPDAVADLSDSNKYATKTYVENAISDINIPEVDLTNYASKDYVATKISEAVLGGNEVVEDAIKDLTANYYTKEDVYTKDETLNKSEINTKLNSYAKVEALEPLATKLEIANSYASKDYVATEIAKIPATDLSNYYNKSQVDAKIPSLAGYATEDYVTTAVNNIDIPVSLSELTSDNNHQLVTAAEKAAWNAKSNFSGNYTDLNGKPDLNFIPLSEKVNLATIADVAEKADQNHEHSYNELKDKPDLTVYATTSEVSSEFDNYVDKTSYAVDKENFLTTTDGYATEKWVESKKYITATDIANKADKSEIIKNTANLTNDAGFITAAEAVAAVEDAISDKLDISTYNNDKETFALKENIPDVSKFITAENVPSYIPEEYVTNDEITNLVTKEELEAVQNTAGQNSVKLLQLDSDLVDINAKLDTIPTKVSDLNNDEGYVTEEALNDYAKTSDIPNVSEFIKMSDVEAKNYLVAGDIAGKLDIQTYNADKVTFANKDDIQTALSSVPDIVLFNENYLVKNPVGGFANGESVMDMTLKNMFIKLLGLEVYVAPELPEGVPEETPEEVGDIIVNESPALVMDGSGNLIECDYDTFYVNMTEEEAAQETTGNCFYQIVDSETGDLVESGYQVSTVYDEEKYMTVAIPDTVTRFHVEKWNPLASNAITGKQGAWERVTFTLTVDNTLSADGYVVWSAENAEVDGGDTIRIVIDA